MTGPPQIPLRAIPEPASRKAGTALHYGNQRKANIKYQVQIPAITAMAARIPAKPHFVLMISPNPQEGPHALLSSMGQGRRRIGAAGPCRSESDG